MRLSSCIQTFDRSTRKIKPESSLFSSAKCGRASTAMEKLGERALLSGANLTAPSFQVVVLKVNLGCAFCRWRVTQVISKISGLKEYTIDASNKQVIAKGDVRFQPKAKNNV